MNLMGDGKSELTRAPLDPSIVRARAHASAVARAQDYQHLKARPAFVVFVFCLAL